MKNFTLFFINFEGGLDKHSAIAVHEGNNGSKRRDALPRLTISISFSPTGTLVRLSSPPVLIWPAVNQGPNEKIPSNFVNVSALGILYSTNPSQLKDHAEEVSVNFVSKLDIGPYTRSWPRNFQNLRIFKINLIPVDTLDTFSTNPVRMVNND